MALPVVPAWITDYATARHIFCGTDNGPKQAFTQLCAAGVMKFCAVEEKSFRSQPEVNQIFCVTYNCRCNLSADIAAAASALPDRLNGKKHPPSDISSRFIAACAIFNGYGIVSSKAGMFITPVELGLNEGVTSLTLEQFLAAV